MVEQNHRGPIREESDPQKGRMPLYCTDLDGNEISLYVARESIRDKRMMKF